MLFINSGFDSISNINADPANLRTRFDEKEGGRHVSAGTRVLVDT